MDYASRAIFSNIEHQSLELVTDSLRPILELIEQSVNKFLIEDDDVPFEFNVRSLLRDDLKARYEVYAKGRQWGWLTVDDVLRMENENGIGSAGDRYMEPLNMVPVGSDAGRRGAVQVLKLHGTIMPRGGMMSLMSGGASLEMFQKAFASAADDTNAQAIVLEVDSGGMVDQVPEAAAMIYRARRVDRPIVQLPTPWLVLRRTGSPPQQMNWW
ncbi:phage portal protein [Parasedimentitalea psychrophila]|uniref:Phage portal protein n=1 Tax=Parasedimentitalea psychrophila TaxID=2997337 RepID=A0A9Y2KUY9_9RHOB|nr:phage portal protein [Parasedimentitalea psychrophila]WIY23636.1 phage portal protein [Parasedimentitalea psychrophila]